MSQQERPPPYSPYDPQKETQHLAQGGSHSSNVSKAYGSTEQPPSYTSTDYGYPQGEQTLN